MKRIIRMVAATIFLCLFENIVHGQITLIGTSYIQNFNSLGAGLPAGWSVNVTTTASTLGASGSFTTAATSWASTTSVTDFRNVASDDIAFGSSSTTQGNDTNRALGWRPLAAGTDARTGSLMLTLSNTSGFSNFSLSVKVFTGNDGFNGSQIYSLEYRVGSSGSFTPIATYSTPITGASTFNEQVLTANSVTLSALNNQSSNVYFRLRGTTTTGTSLDTVVIDDFSLSYSAIPESSTYAAIIGIITLGCACWRRYQRKNPLSTTTPA
jgi:hypothetical protein